MSTSVQIEGTVEVIVEGCSPILIRRCTDTDVIDDGSTSSGSLMSVEEEDSNVLDTLSLREHVNKNRDAFLAVVDEPPWQLSTLDGGLLIRHPTASKIPSIYLHPGLYRSLSPIADLNALAVALEVDGIVGWESRIESAIAQITVTFYYRNLLQISGPEDHLEDGLKTLMAHLSGALGVECISRPKISFGVGGILADQHYFVRGRTDTVFVTQSEEIILKTEAKTPQNFGLGDLWYRNSRGVQLMGCLFSRFEIAPAILYTQQQFKLFVQSQDRTCVLTYPGGMNTLSVDNGREFLKVLAVCLLKSKALSPSPTGSHAKKSKIMKKEIPPSQLPTASKGDKRRTSARLAQKASKQRSQTSKGRHKPSTRTTFITNELDAEVHEYRTVTLLSQGEIEALEREESAAELREETGKLHIESGVDVADQKNWYTEVWLERLCCGRSGSNE